MNISKQEFNFLTESITSDLIQMLMDERQCTLSQAVDAIYNSETYNAVMRPSTLLYYQSSGYIYHYLSEELGIH